MKRYSKEPLPKYAFIPGNAPHPMKEGGHMHEQGEPQSMPLTNENYRDHEHFLYALDLINQKYYWEAHVYLEAIWNANNRAGNIADLMKALIKICAGEIKNIMGQDAAANDHFKRAKELIGILNSEFLVGINIRELREKHNSLDFLEII